MMEKQTDFCNGAKAKAKAIVRSLSQAYRQ